MSGAAVVGMYQDHQYISSGHRRQALIDGLRRVRDCHIERQR